MLKLRGKLRNTKNITHQSVFENTLGYYFLGSLKQGTKFEFEKVELNFESYFGNLTN